MTQRQLSYEQEGKTWCLIISQISLNHLSIKIAFYKLMTKTISNMQNYMNRVWT